MSLCSSLNRVTKSTSKTASKTATKTATKTKDDGSGTWTDGYVAPRIEIKNTKTNAVVKTGQWKFNPSQLNTMKPGFVLEVTLNTAAEKDVIVSNSPGAKQYIPWRYMESGIKYSKDFNDNKKITLEVTTDSNTNYEIVLVMPFASYGNYITEEQCNNIIKHFEKSRDSDKNKIKSSKSSLITNTQELKVQLDNKAKAQQDQNAIKAAANAENEKIKTNLQAKNAKLDEIQLQIETKTKDLNALSSQSDTLNSEISRLSSEIDADTELLDDAARQKAINQAQNNIDDYKIKIKSEINGIKEYAPDAPSVANANLAQSMAYEFNDAGMTAAFNKIYSWNVRN
jgi:cell division protein FtsB